MNWAAAPDAGVPATLTEKSVVFCWVARSDGSTVFCTHTL
jgi:hypothetical protein